MAATERLRFIINAQRRDSNPSFTAQTRWIAENRDALERASVQARRAVELPQTQYREGLSDFQAVLDSELGALGVSISWEIFFDNRARDAIGNGGRILLKLEPLQHTGSFKVRGAYNRLVQLSPAERAAGVVAFSSGNHAQGVAWAARRLGIAAAIVMPTDAPRAAVR